MVEQDTIKLLRECDAGVRMGVSAIEDVLDDVRQEDFKKCLTACRTGHERLQEELQGLLNRYHDHGKAPNPMAQNMARVKTGMEMAVHRSDKTIADLITDGCNMGVKSLNRYLNQYEAADEASKDIAKRLCDLEEQLAVDIRRFL